MFTEGKSNAVRCATSWTKRMAERKIRAYQNLGDNQIKELISAADCSIFFIDENQQVTLKDIGRKSEIERSAIRAWPAVVTHAKLEIEFRCSGSDGYCASARRRAQVLHLTARREL